MTNSTKNTVKSDNLTSIEQVTEFIDMQPEEVKEEVASRLMSRMTYSGPIPHPSLLKEFDQIIPDGANRIMIMAENQSQHRMKMEEKNLTANNRAHLLGLLFGGSIGLLIVFGAIFLIYNNKNIQGFSLLIGASVAYIGIFLKSQSEED